MHVNNVVSYNNREFTLLSTGLDVSNFDVIEK